MKTVYLKVEVPDDAVISSVQYYPKDIPDFEGLYTTDFEIQYEDGENNEEIKPLKSWRGLVKRKKKLKF